MKRAFPLILGLGLAAAFLHIAGCSDRIECPGLDTVPLNEIHVDVTTGDDAGSGASASPVKTISRGLELAHPGMTVLVTGGTYGVETGERFPLAISDSITVVGEDWEETIIEGGLVTGDTADVTVLIEGVDCVFRRFTVYGDTLRREIRVTASAMRAQIDSVRMPRAPRVAVRVDAARDVTIENCFATHNMKCKCGTGIELASGDTGTVVRGCTLRSYEYAVYFASTTDALIEGCNLAGNGHAFYLCCTDDPVNSPNPDLGGGARGGQGGNSLVDCSTCLKNLTSNTIYARFNTWINDPPVEGEDFVNSGAGHVIW